MTFAEMQALTELLFLPPPIASFVQQQVAAFQAPLAITVLEPGHCLWQVRKASITLAAAAAEPSASGHGSASLLECALHYHQGSFRGCMNFLKLILVCAVLCGE
jgi:hypothetical protein